MKGRGGKRGRKRARERKFFEGIDLANGDSFSVSMKMVDGQIVEISEPIVLSDAEFQRLRAHRPSDAGGSEP